MTSTTGEDPHPEVEEISDYSERLLPPERSAEVRAHLDGCPLCAETLESLKEIHDLLGTLPEERMPADVAGRIDAALAAEALLDSLLPHVPRGTSHDEPGSGPDRLRDVPRETSLAPGGRPPAPTGPGRTGSTRVPRGARRRRGLMVTAYAAGVLALGAAVYGIASTGSASHASLDSAKRDSGVGTPDVAASVHDLLAQQTPAAGGESAASGSDRGNTPMLEKTPHPDIAPAQPAAVPSCVLLATHRSQAPLATQREMFRGADAYLVVLPHPADSSQVDAFVVNASCTASSPGTVLFQASYPR
ncbi:zf-HC2 domain-containing protein [Streptomyces sp. V4-01]|uniref:Zf-HC2 domain-containing protein n=1 Tax=Actinacidiphila polyblastidii TaxID=3110430 RepID=A0ABU7P5G0_9ACTN|nr:zf-HC2 domain-containing protein [Streptomyces sp. V4-01]